MIWVSPVAPRLLRPPTSARPVLLRACASYKMAERCPRLPRPGAAGTRVTLPAPALLAPPASPGRA
eukprot:7304822-Pyramimonas_sp.AAC.1